jgi:predicted ATPase
MGTESNGEGVTEADARTKPPFLRRVRIRGYKSIAFCDVTLGPLTILVGRNASGKSNFLDALAFLRDALRSNLSDAINRRTDTGGPLCRSVDAKQFSIEVESVHLQQPSGERYLLEYALEVPFRPGGWLAPPNERFRTTRLSDGQEMGFTSQEGTARWFGAIGHPFDTGSVTLSSSDHLMLNLFGHPGDAHQLSRGLQRMGFYNFSPTAMRLPRKPNYGLDLDRDGSNLASVIETTRENDKEAIERVGRYLSAITEPVELLGVAKYGEYETVRFRVGRNGRGLPLEFDAASMSDGTLRALAALVAAFQIVLPHGHPSLVAIEEPETSLHPAAMRALVDALDEATGHTQVLLTTQSAELLDNPHVRPENVRVVEMIDGQTVIGPVDEASLEIVRQKLDTLGGLERQNQLGPDADDLERQERLSRTGSGAT